MQIRLTLSHLLFLSIFFICSCNEKQGERLKSEQGNKLGFEQIGQFIVQKEGGNAPFYPQYFEDENGIWFIALNPQKAALDLYNLKLNDTVTVSRSISLKSAQVSGSGILDSYFHNKDSIFVLLDNNTVSLLNSAGRLQHWWAVAERFADGTKGHLVMWPWSRIKYLDKKLYASYGLNSLTPGSPITAAFNRRAIAVADLSQLDSSASVSETLVPFPEIYTKEFYYSYEPANVFAPDGSIVSSFFIDNALYRTVGGKTTVISQPSRIANLEPFPQDSSRNYRYIGKYGIEQPQYSNFSYDAHRKQYYRVLKGSGEWEKEDGTIGMRVNCPWQLIVLDENLSEMGVVEMPADKYVFDMVAPVKDGILVPYFNSAEELRNPKIFRFALLNIQQQ